MKRITPVLLTAFSVLALSLSVASYADTTENDGFLVFEATDATQADSPAPAAAVQAQEVAVQAPADDATDTPTQAQEVAVTAPKAEQKAEKEVKKVKKTKKQVQKKSKRTERKKRVTRTKRSKRSNSLRKAKYYKIRRGDTLYRISVRSGVRLSRLVSLNKLHGSKKHKIQAGQRIRLR